MRARACLGGAGLCRCALGWLLGFQTWALSAVTVYVYVAKIVWHTPLQVEVMRAAVCSSAA